MNSQQPGKILVQPSAKWSVSARRLTLLTVASIIMSALCLSGCGTPQKAQRTLAQMEEKIDLLQQSQLAIEQQLCTMQSDSVRQILSEDAVMSLREDEEVITVTEEFDTSQPVDTTTGTPPIKKRSTEQRRRATQQQDSTKIVSDIRSISTVELECQEKGDLTTDTVADIETEIKTDERFGMSWIQKTFFYLGIAALICFLLWIAWKILKRYLKPF